MLLIQIEYGPHTDLRSPRRWATALPGPGSPTGAQGPTGIGGPTGVAGGGGWIVLRRTARRREQARRWGEHGRDLGRGDHRPARDTRALDAYRLAVPTAGDIARIDPPSPRTPAGPERGPVDVQIHQD